MSNIKYLVVGAGKSGISVAKMLLKMGKDCIIFDGNKDFDVDSFYAKNPEIKAAKVIYGNLESSYLDGIKEAVLSPGVPLDSDIVDIIKSHNIKIIGEIEFAYNNSKGDIVAITGTNGKTTTTSIVGEIFKNYFKEVFVVGNIGLPYTDIILDTTFSSKIVAEISSFQLESTISFRPKVSVILNVTPDHLDRHHTFSNYLKIKESITKNQKENDYCVINYDDKNLLEWSKSLKCKVLYFSTKEKLDQGMFYDKNVIYYANNGNIEKIIEEDELNIIGEHNISNVEAAILVALSFNIPIKIIKKSLKEFKAVAHRIEYVTTKNGIKFYNDSKGTNPDASIKAILSIKEPIILIAGGYDKHISYDEYVSMFKGRVKKAILIGDTKDELKNACDKYGFSDYVFIDNLREAVNTCYKYGKTGDAVLLSPASASWDMFKSYEERGDLFKKYVRELS